MVVIFFPKLAQRLHAGSPLRGRERVGEAAGRCFLFSCCCCNVSFSTPAAVADRGEEAADEVDANNRGDDGALSWHLLCCEAAAVARGGADGDGFGDLHLHLLHREPDAEGQCEADLKQKRDLSGEEAAEKACAAVGLVVRLLLLILIGFRPEVDGQVAHRFFAQDGVQPVALLLRFSVSHSHEHFGEQRHRVNGRRGGNCGRGGGGGCGRRGCS